MAIDLTGPRAAAEAVLFGDGSDECEVIRRPADPTTFNAGDYDVPMPVQVYAGPCSVRANLTSQANRGQEGAVAGTLQRWQISIPIVGSAANPPLPGDVVVMTVARDDAIDGARYVVRDVGGGTNSVLRRVLCERWVAGAGDDWAAPNAE